VSIPAWVHDHLGAWEGSNKLWFDPSAPHFESVTTAELSLAADGRFAVLRYDWTHEGARHEGLLLVGEDASAGRCDAAWVDSFHNSHRMMPCSGPLTIDGVLRATGSYPAPEGPDWQWRVELSCGSGQRLLLRMFNITPDGREALAVEAWYDRRR
jgi:hypothetical protein